MICFEVWINGKKICAAGVGEYGVLSQGLVWVQNRPEDHAPGYQWKPPETHLHVGGLVNDEYIDWVECPFIVETGDEVTIKVVETEAADEPIRRRPKESKEHRLERVQHQLNVVRALLPSPAAEGTFLSSLEGFEEAMTKNKPELAVDVLGELGELNNCPPEFWKGLASVAAALKMYEQAAIYRRKSNATFEP